MDLKKKHCVPCSGGVPPLSESEKANLLKQIDSDWKLINDQKILLRELETKDFVTSLTLANLIGEVAEMQWHHPKLIVEFKMLKIQIWTHKINDLVESDFIFAAKVDEILNNFDESLT